MDETRLWTHFNKLILCLLTKGGVYGAPEDIYDLPGLHFKGVE